MAEELGAQCVTGAAAFAGGNPPTPAAVTTAGPPLINRELASRLCCPHCLPGNSALIAREGMLHCADCGTLYPAARSGSTRIPWLYPEPGLAHLAWSARLRGFLRDNANEYNRLNRSKSRAAAGSATQERIATALLARRAYRDQLMALLEPFGFDGEDLETPTTDLLNDSLPRSQGLTSYAANVFRDWAWENGENEALADAVVSLLASAKHNEAGATLTLGAGACRLPYDLHKRVSPALSVALDINPLLLLIGCKAVHGNSLSLYEFPLAPIAGEGTGVLNHCAAPQALPEDDDFHFALGDATAPPFADGSFDTVVTPWLIDILSTDLYDFVPTVNRLLADGGLWVNVGSMVFRSDDPCRRYSEKEVHEIVESQGFEIVAVDHYHVPYLQSPYSANGRIERMAGFAARKKRTVPCPARASPLPEWITDTSRPVPATAEAAVSSSAHLLNAQVLAAIDGRRSIDAIARLVAREYKLDLTECAFVIQRILLDALPSGNGDSRL